MQRRDFASSGFVYYTVVAFFLYLPILLLIIFSFNDSTRLVLPLKSFTLKWYSALLEARELIEALSNSLMLGLISSGVATALGTMAAIGIARFNFPGRRLFLAVSAMPMVIPYVVLGVALLILFAQWGVPLSLWTVGIGLTIVNIPYAMLIVASRLAGFNPYLEEAAMDLGESYWGALRRVTLPIAAPAIASAFLSSFTTAIDEFALSFFLVGSETTLPIYLYSQLRFPSRLPIIVALAAVLMVFSVVMVLFSEWLRRVGQSTQRQGEG